MKAKMTTLMLGMAAMLASCSSDDALQRVTNDGLTELTITASLPESMTTRATASDDATAEYCYLEIRNADGSALAGAENTVRTMTNNTDGTFSYTVTLNSGTEYMFLCWADNSTATAPASLTSVAYTNGKNIAFAANENHTWGTSGVNLTLKHVVTRVSVKTTVNTTIDDQHPLTVSVPRCYTTYNVYDKATTGSEIVYTYDDFASANGTVDAPAQLGYFYVLCDNYATMAGSPDGTLRTLTMQYTSDKKNNPYDIANVPMRPNYHITLSGDVNNVGLVSGAVTATVDANWTDESMNF